jgi:hypothetical protein
MPLAVARKIEFFVRQSGEDLDIRLVPIILTATQVRQFRLPRIPIRDAVRGKGRFEEQHGEGAVELDALEALHPGEFARIVKAAIDRYQDRKIQARIERTAAQLRQQMSEARNDIIDQHHEHIEAFRLEWEAAQATIQEYQDSINAIYDRIRERAEPLWDSIADDLRAARPDPGEIEWPEPEPADEFPDPLFDSRRNYLDQIERYRDHQGKPNGNGGAS